MKNEKTKYQFNDNKDKTLVLLGDKIEGEMIERRVEKDIFLIQSNLTFKDDILRESNSTVDGLLINFSLKCESSYKSELSDFHFHLRDNSTNISAIKDEIGEMKIKKGGAEALCFIIKKEFLIDNLPESEQRDILLENLDKKVCQYNLSSKKTDFYTKLLLNDIISSPFDDNLNRVFVHSKVLDILHSELKYLFTDHTKLTQSVRLDAYDVIAIKKAKEILIQNVQNPPSILELAKLVRINDFKLKIGFKKIFGITPYNLLIDYKLELARKLLTKNEMNITEISQYIGYKYTQNFTVAFVKKFGVKPRDVMKNSLYYY